MSQSPILHCRPNNFDTGLHEDENIKVIKISKQKTKGGERIRLRAVCKRADVYGVYKITYYDQEGLPLEVTKNYIRKCSRKKSSNKNIICVRNKFIR